LVGYPENGKCSRLGLEVEACGPWLCQHPEHKAGQKADSTCVNLTASVEADERLAAGGWLFGVLSPEIISTFNVAFRLA
jgi:hypothetical protein